MSSHWSGWVLSRHCPEVKREIFDFHFFDESGSRFFEIIQNIDRIMRKTMLMYQKDGAGTLTRPSEKNIIILHNVFLQKMQRKDFWDETMEKAYQRFAGSGNSFRADAPVCICGRAREHSRKKLFR